MNDLEKIYREYKDKHAEKARKEICALLNSGGGRFPLPFLNNVVKANHIDNGVLLEVGIMITEDLFKKLWASSIDANEKLEDIESLIKRVIDNCVGFPHFIIDENEHKLVVMDIEKWEDGNCCFCLKRNVRTLSKGGCDFFYEYYFKVGDKTVKTDNTHLLYFIKLVEFPSLPLIKNYEPSNYTSKKELKQTKEEKNVRFEIIGELTNKSTIFKYMDLESALRCLESRIKDGKVEKKPNLRFVEPTSWDDQYEGRFYTACYKRDDGSGNHVDVNSIIAPFLYACCFSLKQENEAAWVLYSHNKKGLASRCVEFELNRMKLREELVNHLENCSVYIGAVRYLGKESIDRICKPDNNDNQPNEEYLKYFKPFTRECYLNLLLLKRYAFEHEKEVRIFIVPNDKISKQKARRGKDGEFPIDQKPDSIFVDIDWAGVIEKVRCDENCSDYELSLLQNSLNGLAEEKKKRDSLSQEDYEKLLVKLKLEKFNPYIDESLKQGPITIVTNQ